MGIPSFLFLLSAQAAVPTTPVVTLQGADEFGYSVSAGDINGDGFADVVVGSWGEVSLFLGHPGGVSGQPTTLTGDPDSDFGAAVASAGDVDGDGFDDLLVGAPYAAAGRGAVYLVMGSSDGIPEDYETVDLVGTDPNGALGGSVTGAGDLNGDGFDDLVAGARDAKQETGAAYVYYGSEGGLESGPVSEAHLTLTGGGSRFGEQVSSGGDIDGDGLSELFIGSRAQDLAFVYLGDEAGIRETADIELSGSGAFGQDVSSAGDVNGDGYGDLVVGAYRAGSQSQGSAWVYLSTGDGSVDEGRELAGTRSELGFGWSVAGAGDLEGDGFDDIVVGSYDINGAPGEAYVFAGSADGIPAGEDTDADSVLNGPHGGDYFGFSVTGVPDSDGDGCPELLVGAWKTGSAYLFAAASESCETSDAESEDAGCGCGVAGPGGPGTVLLGLFGVLAWRRRRHEGDDRRHLGLQSAPTPGRQVGG